MMKLYSFTYYTIYVSLHQKKWYEYSEINMKSGLLRNLFFRRNANALTNMHSHLAPWPGWSLHLFVC